MVHNTPSVSSAQESMARPKDLLIMHPENENVISVHSLLPPPVFNHHSASRQRKNKQQKQKQKQNNNNNKSKDIILNKMNNNDINMDEEKEELQESLLKKNESINEDGIDTTNPTQQQQPPQTWLVGRNNSEYSKNKGPDMMEVDLNESNKNKHNDSQNSNHQKVGGDVNEMIPQRNMVVRMNSGGSPGGDTQGMVVAKPYRYTGYVSCNLFFCCVCV